LRDAVVAAREDTPGDKRLVAYYTLAETSNPIDDTANAEGLRSHLSATLPEYMLPARFVVLPVFPLIFAAYLPGRIKATMQHPMLAAVKFWAFAHLLSTGLLADGLLFGAFLVWAVCDRISLKRRPPQAIRTAPPGRLNDLIAVIAGLAVYAFFLWWAHLRLFGVSPLA